MSTLPFRDNEAPILFLHSYLSLPRELPPFETEHLDWYRSSDIGELQWTMRSDFKTEINELFRRVGSRTIKFGDPSQNLPARELRLFREATDADRNQMPLSQMHPEDQIKGFWAVISRRTASRSYSSLCRAVELFNHVVAGMLSGTQGEAWALLKPAEGFAPALLSAAEELLYRPEAKGEIGKILHEDGARIQDLRVDLEWLRPVVQRRGWSVSADHLERFLSLGGFIADYLDLKNAQAGSVPTASTEEAS